jgi:hypothetical protein
MEDSSLDSRKHSVLFPVTIFLASFLLFQIQPILGRYVLPHFGGGPSVWTTCLLFFQLLLVAGYAYAHFVGSLRNRSLQVWIHGIALALSLLFFPIAQNAGAWKTVSGTDPSLRILLLLTTSVGGPYVMLAATTPLVQRWFSRSYPEDSPWRLYALSNTGSLLALFTYPGVIEPHWGLSLQTRVWTALYCLFVILCICASLRFRPAAAESETPADPGERPSLAEVLLWFGLAMAGSTLLLATTNQLSERIAAAPFLWVAPLSLYLITFILTFESDRWYRRPLFAIAAGAVVVLACMTLVNRTASSSLSNQMAIYLGTMFVLCMACHGELARSRPATRYLTGFYLSIAGGGALGGVFVAIIAPRVFTFFTELPLGFAIACGLVFASWLRAGVLRSWTTRNFLIRIPLIALLVGALTAGMTIRTQGRDPVQARVRNFYGMLRVVDIPTTQGVIRELDHGPIRHGFQFLQDNLRRRWPTSYYGPNSGAGVVFTAIASPRRVAVIGLGTGTIAAWGRRGDTFRFYEINPAVEPIARTWFSYLKDSQAQVEVVPGDARVQLENELAQGHAGNFSVIAVDAFSGDAIPLHLLTAEAGDLYKRHLVAGGALLLHISNRALDLEPVTRGLAAHMGWTAVLFASGPQEEIGELSAHWVLITNNTALLNYPLLAGSVSHWGDTAPIQWTDDFSSLWHVVRF